MQLRIWEVDGQVAGPFEMKAKLAPGHHDVRFGLTQDVTTWLQAVATGGFGGRTEYYLGEVDFVAVAGGRYVLRGDYDPSRSVRARAWIEDAVTGERIAEATLEPASHSEYFRSWDP